MNPATQVVRKNKVLLEMLSLAGRPTCESTHHPKRFRHGLGEQCPIVTRYMELEEELHSLKAPIKKVLTNN